MNSKYIRLKGRAGRKEGAAAGCGGRAGGRKDVRFTLSNCSNKHANISWRGNERKRGVTAQIVCTR